MANGEPDVVGGPQSGGLESAPKGKRFASALIDLLLIPVVLGVLAGVILLAVPEGLRNVILIVINIGWLIFRDTVFAPGRKMVGLRLVSADGGKATIGQAFIRNILILIPFILVAGYIVEISFIASKGHRVADHWAKTRVVVA